MKKICPDLFVKDIFHIDYSSLWKQGFRLLVFDIDHTLLPCGPRRLTVDTKRKLRELQRMGFRIAFLTNTVVPWREKRAREIAESAKNKNVILVCCNFFRCKPSRWGFNEVCLRTGIRAESAVMVGDLLGRDIGGAQKADFGFTVLVQPKGRDNIWVSRSRKKELPTKKWLEEIGLIVHK